MIVATPHYIDSCGCVASARLHSRYMLWNVTNPDDVLQGAKPDVQLVGPWTYEERNVKHSFLFNSDESVIYYKQNRSFHYLDVPCPPGANFSDYCKWAYFSHLFKNHFVNADFDVDATSDGIRSRILMRMRMLLRISWRLIFPHAAYLRYDASHLSIHARTRTHAHSHARTHARTHRMRMRVQAVCQKIRWSPRSTFR